MKRIGALRVTLTFADLRNAVGERSAHVVTARVQIVQFHPRVVLQPPSPSPIRYVGFEDVNVLFNVLEGWIDVFCEAAGRAPLKGGLVSVFVLVFVAQNQLRQVRQS